MDSRATLRVDTGLYMDHILAATEDLAWDSCFFDLPKLLTAANIFRASGRILIFLGCFWGPSEKVDLLIHGWLGNEHMYFQS